MIFGLLAIFCWVLLLVMLAALVRAVAIKSLRRFLTSSAFLVGACAAGVLAWHAIAPGWMSFRMAIDAGLTAGGTERYGHPIEHAAENSIVLSTYACVLGGGVCAVIARAGLRVAARRKGA